MARRRPGREDLGAHRADRGHRAAGLAARRARRRRLPGRERRDHDREPGRVHPVPVHDDHAARPGVRRAHLGQPGARRARPHPGDHRDPERGRGRRARSSRPRRSRRMPRSRFDDVRFAYPEAAHKTEREKAIAAAVGEDALAPRATARCCTASRSRCRAARASPWSDRRGAGKSTILALDRALLRPDRRRRAARRRRRARHRPRDPARPDRLRRAGRPGARRHAARQPHARLTRRDRRAVHRACCAPSTSTRCSTATRAGLDARGRRRRRHALGRRAPAPRDRACAARGAARSCCSTRRPPRSTASTSSCCARRSTRSPRTAPCW